MMGHRFWEGLAKNIGVKIAQAGAPMVKKASAPVEMTPIPDRIVLHEASAAGFFRIARSMGWGLYRVEDIDGGLGSIWSIEKDAETGGHFLVKQTDPMGEVMRAKTASAESKKCSRCHGSGGEPGASGEQQPCSACKGEGKMKSASVQRIIVAPPREKKLAKKIIKEIGAENQWAIAWSAHSKKKADMADVPSPNASSVIAKRLAEIRGELEYGNSDDARDWLHALSAETPGALGRKLNLVWHAMEKDTEHGIDEMVTLFREIGGDEHEWDMATDGEDHNADLQCPGCAKIDPHMTEHGIGRKPENSAAISDSDVIIREAAEKCPTCNKPIKENTDGNPKYCQGHD